MAPEKGGHRRSSAVAHGAIPSRRQAAYAASMQPTFATTMTSSIGSFVRGARIGRKSGG